MKYNCDGILYIDGKTISVGDVVTICNKSWRVLHKESGLALVITENLIDVRQLEYGSDYCRYDDTSTREYLNGNFLRDSIKRDFLPLIKRVYKDKAFLLSKDEALQYFVDDPSRVAISKYNKNESWWLRTQDDQLDKAYFVSESGKVSKYPLPIHCILGLRVAMYIRLDEAIDWNSINRLEKPLDCVMNCPYEGMDEDAIVTTACGPYYSSMLFSNEHYYSWMSALDCKYMTVVCKDHKVIRVNKYYLDSHWNEDGTVKYRGIAFNEYE